jgi:hypothetical protein
MSDPKLGDVRLWRMRTHLGEWELRCADLHEAVTVADTVNALAKDYREPIPITVQRFESGGWTEVSPMELRGIQVTSGPIAATRDQLADEFADELARVRENDDALRAYNDGYRRALGRALDILTKNIEAMRAGDR